MTRVEKDLDLDSRSTYKDLQNNYHPSLANNWTFIVEIQFLLYLILHISDFCSHCDDRYLISNRNFIFRKKTFLNRMLQFSLFLKSCEK